MTVGDLFFTEINCSTNNRSWSTHFWLKETVNYAGGDDLQPIANQLKVDLIAGLQGILSIDTNIESWNVWRRWTDSGRPGQLLEQSTSGARPGQVMSNDNALYINLRQDTVNAKFNGGMYIGGLSGDDQDANVWDQSFLDTQVKAFTDLFEQPLVTGSPNNGSFAYAVVSKAYTPPSTPLGTAFEVFKAVPSTRVSTQRRRRQKVRGWG
ncbi:MAG: hypothetical protein ACR2RE_01385 [Geminicoccaceae bacterium]